jgi:hypothetical protein
VSDRILITTSDAEEGAAPGNPLLWRGVALAMLALAVVGWSLISTGDPDVPEPDPTLIPKPFSAPTGTWSEIEFSGDGAFTSVLQFGDVLIAAGTGRRVDSIPFIWTSSDSSVWSKATGPWQPGDLIVALAPYSEGYLAAGYRIGFDFRGGITDAEPKIWRSQDGASWESAATTGLPEGGLISGVTAAADAVIAIGWEGPAALEPLDMPIAEGSPRVWSSADGIEWTDITPDGPATFFADVAPTPAGVAVGGADDSGPAIWTLDDGAWMPLPGSDSDAATVSALTVGPEGEMIALTRSRTDPESLVHVWTVSAEGDWTAIPTGSKRPGAGGWVEVIGGDLFAGSGFTRTVISNGPELWVSQRGAEWIGVEVTAGVTPWPPPRITAMIERDGRLFAFGSRGVGPAAWQLIED